MLFQNRTEKVIIIDFGSQVTKLIARRIRELGVYSEIITPKDVNERGCQLSIVAHGSDKILFDKLSENGVVADWREPNVIRIAPVPLYNSFEDVYRFGEILEKSL